MKTYLPNIADLKFGWNSKMLTEIDFYKLCKKYKISVAVMPLKRRGYYSKTKGKHHIAIKSGMPDFQTLFVMFHELGHYIMHSPGGAQSARFSGVPADTREEKEADAFAYCALLPLSLLTTRSPEELTELDGYTNQFLIRRLKIYERYGI